MAEWEAPAKLNFDLRVRARDTGGKHPIRSLVQTIEWCDVVAVEVGDEDELVMAGVREGEIPEGGENLVWKAVSALSIPSRPPIYVNLEKRVAVAAGLGGGSSDAAAVLMAVGDLLGLGDERVREAAARVGADVTFFLLGGTAVIEGYGEVVSPIPALDGFAVAVAVPPFELSTADVYRRWDDLGGPEGVEVQSKALPPTLRAEGPFRNDLTPAAVSVRPELADWMVDLSQRWGTTVMMSGSGPSCFAFFMDQDEATSAVSEVTERRSAVAAALRRRGVARPER